MNRSSWTPLASVLSSVVLLGAALAISASAAPVKGVAAEGKKLYLAKACGSCHKPDGVGGFKALPAGNPTPNWKIAKTWADPKHTDDFMRDCLTNGKPKSGMIAWGKSGMLKPAEIENLIAYIKTFAPKK
jgi:mono/diheme cytochrome c family protein